MTDYYLSAGATRHDGRRYVRGDKLPTDVGKTLAGRGLAVTDPADLTRDLRPIVPAATDPKVEQRSTLAGSQTSLVNQAALEQTVADELKAELARRERELDEREEALDAREAALGQGQTPDPAGADPTAPPAAAPGHVAGSVTVNEAQKPATTPRSGRKG